MSLDERLIVTGEPLKHQYPAPKVRIAIIAMFNPHSAFANKAALTAPIAIAVKKTRLTSRALFILTDATRKEISWFPTETFGKFTDLLLIQAECI